MKWVTREGAKTDRVACPRLIRRFIDKEAEFLFVPKERVLDTAKQVGGKSFDAPGADYTHRGKKCTFEVLLEDFKVTGQALTRLDDHEKLRLQFPLYDALYAYCRQETR